ncbi:MAG: antibiotic biosynthesis monooxygenase [Gammaproteobacteria bacterium]|nr:antibiotic biosynthesis monooxygenase [Gammaproteobacteria bacterium]
MIHVIAIITTAPGKRSEVLEAFAKLVPLVHAEVGCVEYQPVIDAKNASSIQTPLGEDSYIVVEKWASMDDLNAHSASPHMQEFGRSFGHLIADRTIHVLQGSMSIE